MAEKERSYISVYFGDASADNRKRRDVTIAFNGSDELYGRCSRLGSTEIKRIIEVSSYSELVQRARIEDRSISNYIKHKLRVHFANEETNTLS